MIPLCNILISKKLRISLKSQVNKKRNLTCIFLSVYFFYFLFDVYLCVSLLCVCLHVWFIMCLFVSCCLSVCLFLCFVWVSLFFCLFFCLFLSMFDLSVVCKNCLFVFLIYVCLYALCALIFDCFCFLSAFIICFCFYVHFCIFQRGN